MKKIVMIIIAIVVVAALAVGAWFLFKPAPKTEAVAPVETVETVEEAEATEAPQEVVDETADPEAQG